MSTWRDKNFFDGDKLPADDLNHLDENFDALAEGASGAPSITASLSPSHMYATAISSQNASHLGQMDQDVSQSAIPYFNGIALANNSIQQSEMDSDSVGGPEIIDLAVDTIAIANNAVTNAKVAADAADSPQIADDAVKNRHIAADAVDTTQLANDAVNGPRIAANAVDTGHIANDAVQNAQIAADAVDTAQLANNAVTEARIAGGSVARSQLKTATGEVSYSSGGVLDLGSVQSAPGGQYGFLYEDNHSPESNLEGDETHATGAMPGAHSSINTGTWVGFTPSDDQSLSYDSRITLMAMADASTIKARQRYIQASPPYDLGDGECGLFIQPEVMKNGRIRNLYIAPDPPWANNGPTDIHPDYEDKEGNKYKTKRVPAITREYVDSGSADLIEWVAALREAPSTTFPITNEFKNADMALCPHSVHSELRGEICLLDPCTTHDLLLLHDEGEEISQLLLDGYIEIGDPLSRYGPPGVTVRDWKFKNTKRTS